MSDKFQLIRIFEGGVSDCARFCGISTVNLKRIVQQRLWRNEKVEKGVDRWLQEKLADVQVKIERLNS